MLFHADRGGVCGGDAVGSERSPEDSGGVWPNSSMHTFVAAPHQVAGHLFQDGKCGSLVSEPRDGCFYKPLQRGHRGQRELQFYLTLKSSTCDDPDASPSTSAASTSSGSGASDEDDAPASRSGGGSLVALSSLVPRFYGTLVLDGVTYVKLEDVAGQYACPSILDVKVGFRTWYPSATESHIAKCKVKDAATTSSSLGFKVCGVQVYDRDRGTFWRTTKKFCKGLDGDSVRDVLRRFVKQSGLSPREFCLGEAGIANPLQALMRWCETQRRFHFYSASILLIYEGKPAYERGGANPPPRLRLIDFAHTLNAGGEKDQNFIAGLASFKAVLEEIGSEVEGGEPQEAL